MDCPHCSQEMEVKKRAAQGGLYLKSAHGPDGRHINGVDSETIVKGQTYQGFPRCPECKEFVGATSEDFEESTHSHECSKCGWKSQIYNGDFV